MNTAMKETAVERLGSIRNELAVALIQQDWEKISVLDLDCRTLVDLAMAEAVEKGEEQLLRANLESLLELYALAVNTCKKHRDEAGAELGNLNRARQNAKVYQLFG
jgi:flagellar protein FliT